MRFAKKLLATACVLLTAGVGHSAQKLREITEQEAHRLLTRHLKLTDRAVYRLGGDFGYKTFYFFQAEEEVASANLEDPTLGVLQVGYYAVDRKTADIWDAGFCQEISSPRLAQLKVALRKRIGLTDTEYQKLRKPGPFCEPGYPRLPARPGSTATPLIRTKK
jgi:hypothetical protein